MEKHNDTATASTALSQVGQEPTMAKYDHTASARVALLIDADNFSPQHAMGLFNQAAVHGNVIVRRAYGVIHEGFQWKPELLHQYAIEPVMRFHYAKGKNVADIALVIDAMELMRLRTVDAVCIASNDSDFSLLAMKLRENGIKVYGFGDQRALPSFVASCDEFVRFVAPKNEKDKTALPEQDSTPHLDAKDKATPPEKDNPSRSVAGVNKVRKMLTDACDSLNSDDAGWVNLGGITNYLKRVDTSFTPKQYGFGKMLDLIESMPDYFDIRHDKNGPVSIRKKTAKSGKAAK